LGVRGIYFAIVQKPLVGEVERNKRSELRSRSASIVAAMNRVLTVF